jgi:crotonobetainyl-CoA:carnitine CoA-transferase CaiB-like acyl-CoA transferase
LWLLSPVITSYVVGGQAPQQLGNASLTRLPTADTFPTGDGYLQVSAITGAQIRAVWSVLGRPGVPEDPRYATAESQVARAAELRAQLIECLAAKTAAEWAEALNGAGVPACRVATVPEVVDDEQVGHRNAILEFAGREGFPPSIALNAGFHASADGPGTQRPAPFLGEHTAEILAEIGLG